MFGLVDVRADGDIRSRLESLLEPEEHYDDEEGYGRSASPSQVQEVSDDQIRSMFQGLLGR